MTFRNAVERSGAHFTTPRTNITPTVPMTYRLQSVVLALNNLASSCSSLGHGILVVMLLDFASNSRREIVDPHTQLSMPDIMIQVQISVLSLVGSQKPIGNAAMLKTGLFTRSQERPEAERPENVQANSLRKPP